MYKIKSRDGILFLSISGGSFLSVFLPVKIKRTYFLTTKYRGVEMTKDNELLTILKRRDGDLLGQQEYSEMLDRLHLGQNPEEILYDYNLEPDYVLDLVTSYCLISE